MAEGTNGSNGADESGLSIADSGIEVINPADFAFPGTTPSTDSGGSEPIRSKASEAARKRWATRRANQAAGTSGGSAKKDGSLNVNSIQFALTGIHALLAAGLATPELEWTDVEAKTISENIVAVARHYELQQTAKATDWGNLVVSLGIVYGGRIIRIQARHKSEAAARKVRNTGFQPVAQTNAPPVPGPQQTATVAHPVAAGKPTGANPPTRAKTREDDALLNEIEPAMFSS